jgi:hypothetical protein
MFEAKLFWVYQDLMFNAPLEVLKYTMDNRFVSTGEAISTRLFGADWGGAALSTWSGWSARPLWVSF